MSPEEEPLTDEELAAMWKRATRHHISENDLWALLREVHRLRSDDWLARAAEEITDTEVSEGYVEEAAVVAILREHRDRKA